MSLSLADSAFAGSANPPGSLAFNTNPVVGDALFCALTFATTAGNYGTLTVSDTVNGAWSPLVLNFNATQNVITAIFWVRATSTSIPTVSCSMGSNQYGYLSIGRITGFVGTATADASIAATAYGNSTTPALSPITTNYANEVLILSVCPQGLNALSLPSGWTDWGNGNYQVYAIEPTSGTTNNYSATILTAQGWGVGVAGIYDKTTATPVSPLLYNRKNVLYFT